MTAHPKIGDLVTAQHPSLKRSEIIKRVVFVDQSSVDLRGDNHNASTDSRTFGSIPMTDITGRVVGRI